MVNCTECSASTSRSRPAVFVNSVKTLFTKRVFPGDGYTHAINAVPSLFCRCKDCLNSSASRKEAGKRDMYKRKKNIVHKN